MFEMIVETAAQPQAEGAGAAPPSAQPAFQIPVERPEHDATFTTPLPAKKGAVVPPELRAVPPDYPGYVVGRCVGVLMTQTRRGEQMLRLAHQVDPGQLALRDGKMINVGGEYFTQDCSLNGGAWDITFQALKIMGYSASAANVAYAQDTDAVALKQQAASEGRTPAQQVEAMGLLALSRGDTAACGLGQPARYVVIDDRFEPQNGGPAIVSRRCKYINAVPRKADASALLGLLGRVPVAGAKPGGAAKPAFRGGTSAPPAGASPGGPPPDNFDF